MIINTLTIGTAPDLVIMQAQADAGNPPANLAQVIETSRQKLHANHIEKQKALKADDDNRQKRSGVRKDQ